MSVVGYHYTPRHDAHLTQTAFGCCLRILLTDAQFIFWDSRESLVKLCFSATLAEIKLGQLISMLFMLRGGFRLFQGLSVPSVLEICI